MTLAATIHTPIQDILMIGSTGNIYYFGRRLLELIEGSSIHILNILQSHGTRCAGEVAAARDNGVCGVGVAYDSKIAGKSLSFFIYFCTARSWLNELVFAILLIN